MGIHLLMASAIFFAFRRAGSVFVALILIHGHDDIGNQHHIGQKRSQCSGVRRIACDGSALREGAWSRSSLNAPLKTVPTVRK